MVWWYHKCDSGWTHIKQYILFSDINLKKKSNLTITCASQVHFESKTMMAKFATREYMIFGAKKVFGRKISEVNRFQTHTSSMGKQEVLGSFTINKFSGRHMSVYKVVLTKNFSLQLILQSTIAASVVIAFTFIKHKVRLLILDLVSSRIQIFPC